MTPRRGTRRTTLRTYGEHGRSVRVFTERGGDLVRAQWRDPVTRRVRTQSWPNAEAGRAAARAFAQGAADRLVAAATPTPPAPLTLRALWTRYHEAEFPAQRRRTQELNADAWRKFALFVGRDTIAEDVGPDTLARFRGALEQQGLAINTIRRVIGGVKLVYAWAERLEVIGRNRLHLYRFKVAKDRRPKPVAEFRAEEFQRLCGAIAIEGAAATRTWRAGGVVRLCGYQGVRQNAVRHLRVEDLDFLAGRIHWRAEWDKLGRDWWQPMRAPTRATLVLLLAMHQRIGYAGPWLFPKSRDHGAGEVYTAQALWQVLTAAEVRAGVPHIRGRGAHGLRRMLAGDVLKLTGNLKAAGDAIGDRDVRVLLQSYLVERVDEQTAVFDALDAAAAAPGPAAPAPRTSPETATQTAIPAAGARDA